MSKMFWYGVLAGIAATLVALFVGKKIANAKKDEIAALKKATKDALSLKKKAKSEAFENVTVETTDKK